MNLIKPRIFDFNPNIVSGVSTVKGGVSPEPLGLNLSYKVNDLPENVEKNRSIFFGQLGIDLTSLAIPGQVHGDNLLIVNDPGNYPNYDALITRKSNLYLISTIADCIPILIYDKGENIVAAVHAGWRGTEKQIILKTIKKMISTFNTQSRNIYAYLGPSAHDCCYSVGNDVAERFGSKYLRLSTGNNPRLDLVSVNYDLLTTAGVIENQIEISPYCTICNPLFHSYRRGGEFSGRMMAVIGLKSY
jgi:polyphenol oxidase